MNALRRKIENGERVLGTLVCLTDPCLCEIMGNIGYDCVWVDTEHTYISCKEVLCHLNAARGANIPVVVRLPQNDLTSTKKILEMGPDGIIFPMVRTKKEAEELLSMTLYPPLGTRGFGPLRAIGWGAMDAKEYVEKNSFDCCRFMQIEHIDMIEELDEIAKLPYIDGFIFGPNDLSASLGEFLDVFEESTMNKIKEAIEILRRNGKYVGLAGGAAERDIKAWTSLGIDMLFSGADWGFVYTKGKETLDLMRKCFK